VSQTEVIILNPGEDDDEADEAEQDGEEGQSAMDLQRGSVSNMNRERNTRERNRNMNRNRSPTWNHQGWPMVSFMKRAMKAAAGAKTHLSSR
jgi:hypothetical protein